MFRKHCSDDQLLSFMDGELGGRAAAGVARHLESCWLCRGRQQELEAAAQRLARMVDHAEYPDAQWLAAARERLDAAIERREAAAVVVEGPRRLWWRWILVPAACAAAAASVFLATRPPRPVPIVPRPQARPLVRPAAPRSIPAPLPAPARPKGAKPVPVVEDLPARLTLRVEEQDLLATLVAAEYALHRAGACLGEAVDATVTAEGGIVIRGVVETAARRAELEGSLARFPLISFELQAAEEIPAPAAADLPAPSLTVQPAELPVRGMLEERFRGDPRAIAGFAGRAAELAEAIHTETWALRRLAEKYPAEKTASLRAATRWLLEDMIREHSAAVRRHSAALREHLAIVFGRDAAESSPLPAAWPDSAAQLAEGAGEAGLLARGLFAGGPLNQDPAEAVRRLMARASAMEASAREVERAAHGLLEHKDVRAQNPAPEQ